MQLRDENVAPAFDSVALISRGQWRPCGHGLGMMDSRDQDEVVEASESHRFRVAQVRNLLLERSLVRAQLDRKHLAENG